MIIGINVYQLQSHHIGKSLLDLGRRNVAVSCNIFNGGELEPGFTWLEIQLEKFSVENLYPEDNIKNHFAGKITHGNFPPGDNISKKDFHQGIF